MKAALLRTLTEHKYEVCSVAFSPDGNLLASGGGYRDNAIRLWDTRTWAPRHVLRGHKGKVSFLAFHPSGKTLASASHDRTLKLSRGRGHE
jgi:WD40 repeat protein